ncbi:MAG: molybdopterin-dependent oxidoreductase [Eubacteriales bacterium]|nr:molybdopterin-dependent oxidoreductase [Eubacteriales bacterium]
MVMELDCKSLYINGVKRCVTFEPGRDTLAGVLRRLGLTGTKIGCGVGVCGACSVLMNGEVVRACCLRIRDVPEDAEILTIEGIGTAAQLHPLQQAWITYDGVQCGFCTPGFIISAYALLKANDNPNRREVRQWFHEHHNLCRCTGYKPIVDAVMAAAAVMRGEKSVEAISRRISLDGTAEDTAVTCTGELARVLGLCDFGNDVSLKMPTGTLETAPVQLHEYRRARILEADLREAEKMPGVVKIITAKDLYAVGGSNRIPRQSGEEPGFPRPVFTEGELLCRGDVAAVICADTRAHARAAAAAVHERFQRLDDECVRDEQVSDSHKLRKLVKNEVPGETRVLLDESAYLAEGSFSVSREPELSMESDALQAYYDPDGMLVIRCKARTAVDCRSELGSCVGVPGESIRVIGHPFRASFGGSASFWDLALIAACTVVTGHPCNLTMTCSERRYSAGKGAVCRFNARMGCDEQGKITAYEYEAAFNAGAFSGPSHVPAERMFYFNGSPYYIPNMTALLRMTDTENGGVVVADRDADVLWAEACSEQMVDILAEKAGVDPFEFRYMNLVCEGQTAADGKPYREYPMKRIFDAMRPLYREAKDWAKSGEKPEKRRGVGVAFGSVPAETEDGGEEILYGLFMAEVEVDPETGKTKVLKYITVCDVGPVGRRLALEASAYGGNALCIGSVLGGEREKNGKGADCGIPSVLEVPDDMQIYSVSAGRTSGPKDPDDCVGLFRNGGAVSIINAIYNACGVRLSSLCAEPEMLRKELEKLS